MSDIVFYSFLKLYLFFLISFIANAVSFNIQVI